MSADDHLSQQQFTPEQVSVLRAGDFRGSIGDEAARDRFKRNAFSSSFLRDSHREAGGPLEYLDQFTAKVKAVGKIEQPVEVVAHDDYYSLHDGHHRALAAHAAGLPLPYTVIKDFRNERH